MAIVGGGFTGLAAAQELRAAGHEVTLFERNAYLGGLASGFKARGWDWSLERYYHHWFESDAAVERYAAAWNLERGMRFSRPSTVMQLRDGSFRKLDSALALLAFPDMPFPSRVRMGAALAWLKTVKDWRRLESLTAKDWCVRWMGEAGFDAVWKPLLLGKFGAAYAEEVNMAWLWARIACRTPRLGTFEGGFAAFVEGAEQALRAAGVRIVKGVTLAPLERAVDGSWIVQSDLGGGNFDRVIIAAAPAAKVALLPGTPQSRGTPHLGAQVVILSLRKGVGPHYWYSLRKSHAQPFLALIEHTNFVEKRHFADETIVYLADYVDTASADWARSDAALIASAMEVCRGINTALEPADMLESWVFREDYAQPIPRCDQGASLPPLAVEGAPGVFHASMGHVYPWDRGTNFALELGATVARAASGV